MKKSYLIIGGIILVIIIAVGSYASTYNKAVGLQEEVNNEWGDVQSAYQRRADLVPQLVATVKGAAENEKEILIKVTQARSGIINAKSPQDMELLGKEINTAINLAFERYPQIKSTENFAALQAQLEGTENRINVARDRFSDSAKKFNKKIKKIPGRLFNALAGFEEKGYFKSDKGAEKAPELFK